MEYKKELKIAKIAARQAGKMLRREFLAGKKQTIAYKKNNERVTKLDKKSEAIIFRHLNKNFSAYARLSEESGLLDKKSDYFWVIDPLDGTTNFTVHHPMFAVALALFHKNKVVMGVVYEPVTNDMYWAVLGQGAYLNNQKIREIGRAHV